MEKNFVYCMIKVKQETIPWNWNQANPLLRKQRQDELNEKYSKDFYRVLNTVVDSGGVICMDKQTLDSEWRITQPSLRIKIPLGSVEKIKLLPQLESFVLDNRTT